MTRRNLLRAIVGSAFLAPLAMSLSRCSSSESPANPATSKTFTSSSDNGHSHSITIENAEVQSPPANGVSKTTSSVSAHTHSFAMNQAQLTTVNGGGSVTVTSGSSDVGGAHTHTFTITKWF